MKKNLSFAVRKKKRARPDVHRKGSSCPPPEHLGATLAARYQFWPQGTCEKAHNAPGLFAPSVFSSSLPPRPDRKHTITSWLEMIKPSPKFKKKKHGGGGVSDTIFNSQTAELSISTRVTRSSSSSGRIPGSVQQITGTKPETNISEGSSLFPFFPPLTRVFFRHELLCGGRASLYLLQHDKSISRGADTGLVETKWAQENRKKKKKKNLKRTQSRSSYSCKTISLLGNNADLMNK